MLGFLALVPKQVWFGVGVFCICVGLYTFVYNSGATTAKETIAIQSSTAVIRTIKAKGKLKQEVLRLDDAALDERLAKWMRD